MAGFNIWPFRRLADGKKAGSSQPSELRIATSGSFSIRASIENLKVDGAGSYSNPGRVRAALFVPSTVTTVQFHGDANKKPGPNARSQCVHVLQMFTAGETKSILDDALRIGTTIGWCVHRAHFLLPSLFGCCTRMHLSPRRRMEALRFGA